MPGFFQAVADRSIDGVYAKYPITAQGYSNCIEMDNNPLFHATVPGYYEINEIVGKPVYVLPGDHIVLSAWLYAEDPTTADTYLFRGARPIMDMYGSGGRICEIGLSDGTRTYGASQTTIADQTCAIRGTNVWKFVKFDFVVANQYLADPWGAFATNTPVIPTYFNAIVIDGCSPNYQTTEFGRIWIWDLQLNVS